METLDRIKGLLTLSTTTNDALLLEIIKGGKSTIETFTGRKFWGEVEKKHYKNPIRLLTEYETIIVSAVAEGEETIIGEEDYFIIDNILDFKTTVRADYIKIIYSLKPTDAIEQILVNYSSRVFKKGKHAGEKTSGIAGGGFTT